MGASSSTLEGTPGQVIAPLGAGYGTFVLQALPAGTSSDVAYSNTVAKAGSTSARCNSTTQAASHYCTTVAGTTYFRSYVYLTAAPTADCMLFGVLGGGYSQSTQIGITADRRLWIGAGMSSINSTPSGAATWTSVANRIPLGAFARIEGQITTGANSKARARLWLPSGAGIESSSTPDNDSGDIISALNLTADDVRIGAQSFIGGWQSFISSGEFMYYDDIAVSDAGWIGPSGTPAPATVKRGLGIVRY